MDDDNDELPVLSTSALAALQDFYVERDNDLKRFEELRSSTSQGDDTIPLSMSMFKEDWNASQFWFTDETATFLAEILLSGVTSETSIAIISAPSVFIQIRNLLLQGNHIKPARLCLLEFDERFDMLGGFVKYDFNKPTGLPGDMRGGFNRILCDPPSHSERCVVKYAETVKWLAKVSEVKGGGSEILKMICTGETMKDVVEELFEEVCITDFRPKHIVRLDNRYACFANVKL